MFFSSRLDQIEPGRRFRPRVDGLVIETAEVVAIQPDGRGIPHVHFALSVGTPSCPATSAVSRILALERFAEVYPVRL
jgi:hypothetical protein